MTDAWADFPIVNQAATADPWADFPRAEPSTTADVAKSLGVGVGKGVIGTLTSPRDIWDLLAYGATKGVAKGAEFAGMLPKGKTADDLMADINKLDVPRDPVGIPSGAEVQKGVEQLTGKFYEPKTTAGKYAKTGAEFTTGAAMTGGLGPLNLLRNGILPGAASEGAGQYFEGTAAEPWARAIAGLGTSAAGSLAGRPSVDTRMVAQATRGATGADINSAMRLMSDSNQRGVKLTWPEALQQVTGGATQAGRLQRVVEGTKEGGAIMAPAMAQRPAQVAGAVNNTLDNIAPAAARPSDIAPAVQNIGIEANQAAEALRTRAASPYYQAAQTDQLNPNAVKSISDQFERAAASDKTGVLSKPLNDARNLIVDQPGAPAQPATRTARQLPNGNIYDHTPAIPAKPESLINDVENLDRARKFLRDKVELPPFAAEAIPKEQGKVVTGLLSNLRDRMERASRDYRTGRAVYEQKSKNIVEPFSASPTGQLANAATPEAQAGLLFNQNPLPNSQRQVSNAIGSIANRDPDLANSFVRQNLERNFNEATQNLQPGANQYGGAKFAAQIAGNPQQETNLQSILQTLPNGGAKADDVRGLLDTLQATGKRQQPGSMTAFNASDMKDMAGGGLLSGAADSIKTGNPMSLMKQMKEGFDRTRLGARSESVARGLLGSPEEVKMLLTKARQASPEGRAAREIIGILGGNNQNLRLPAP